MTGLQPMIANMAINADQGKSKFFKINNDMFLNPRQVAMVVPGERSGTSMILGPDTTVLATITDTAPEDVVKVLDFYA